MPSIRYFQVRLALAIVIGSAPVTSGSAQERGVHGVSVPTGKVQSLVQQGEKATIRFEESERMEDANSAQAFLQQAQKLQPGSQEIRARLALLTCMVSRNKHSKDLLRAGLSEIDQAAANSTDSITVLVIRGFVGVEAPRSFKRLDQGVADLQHIVDRARRDPSSIKRVGLDMSRVYLKLGNGLRAQGKMLEARAAWQQAVNTGPLSNCALAAARLLDQFGASSHR